MSGPRSKLNLQSGSALAKSPAIRDLLVPPALPQFLSPLPRGVFAGLIGALIVVHVWIALAAAQHKSTTNDEIAHITSGYAFNELADFRVQPENGVLPQRLHALPLAWTEPQFPDLNDTPWTRVLSYTLSYDFFYRSGNDPDHLLTQARAMNMVWSVGILMLIAGISSRFFGAIPALFSVTLAALSPTFLAHSALATSDMAMAFFFVASTTAFWWHLNRFDRLSFIVSALTFGLACGAKFSAVMLLPMMAIMILLRGFMGRSLGRHAQAMDRPAYRFGRLLLSWLGHGLVAVVVIWALYGFRFAMMSPGVPPGTLPLAWDHVLSENQAWEPLVFALRDFHILPEAFLYGFSYVLAFSAARGAFLDGEVGVSGWVEFFPKTFIYKTPSWELLSFTLAVLLTALWARKNPVSCRRALYRFCPALVLFGVYWTFSLTSNLNIGHRHILPTYPALFVGTGALVWLVITRLPRGGNLRRFSLVGLGAILIGQAFTAASIHPHHLAYFNPLAGGPSKGYRHLVDSSLDWGQDLPGLSKWIESRAETAPLYLAYFGTGEPTAYGIEATRLPGLPSFGRERAPHRLGPGIYAISATMLQHAYQQKHQPWTIESEQLFQNLRQLEPAFMASRNASAEQRAEAGYASIEDWQHAWEIYEELRFARLCQFLKVRPPDAMIGYSILIFELDQSELDGAIGGDLAALSEAMERALKRPFAPQIF
jgi:hypothetical protein